MGAHIFYAFFTGAMEASGVVLHLGSSMLFVRDFSSIEQHPLQALLWHSSTESRKLVKAL